MSKRSVGVVNRQVRQSDASQAKSSGRPSLLMKPVPSLPEVVGGDDGIPGDDDEIDEEVDSDSMTEMLTMLQELQKRKATKASARTVAFQNQKAALFAEARKRSDTVIREGAAALDQARATIADIRAQEASQDSMLSSLKALWESQDGCVQDLLGTLNGIIDDLAPRRAEQINEASAMRMCAVAGPTCLLIHNPTTVVEAHVVALESSRRNLLAQAQASVEENIENQKIATDASNLIKHYKALLRS
ncbi:hypothetical protein C8Q77DRAFT_515028 [Trametes polyzona]|nr:hypothetical protein C8Q77DRAFT_515028 [Trametes polyzona]